MTHAAVKSRIEALMIERAPWLFDDQFGRAELRAFLGRTLSYPQTLQLAAELLPQSAPDIMDHMAKRLAQNVTATGLHRIPKDGPALLVCNHPTGIADAIMLWSAIRPRRDDAYYFANRDVLRVLPQLSSIIAPVEWRNDKRSHSKTRETLEFARRATEQGRLGVIFPSGRLAYRDGLRLKERPWMTSAASLARKFDLPVIPVTLKARNSALFYILSSLHPSLRDITLFHETLNKADAQIRLHVGSPVMGRDLPTDPNRATQVLRSMCLCDRDQPLLQRSPLKRLKPAQAASAA